MDREAWTALLSLAAPSLIRTPVTAAAVITGVALPPSDHADHAAYHMHAATFLLSLSPLSRPRVSSLMSSFLIFHSKTNKTPMKREGGLFLRGVDRREIPQGSTERTL
ncbi:hypothetical protein CEXT_199101 [Caerostris extrusa]|uniref:Secreted protein n=1 Tax=Caerostris extrusa TaxID=172846 RepID=A0AAV4WUY5_CAEEX|nr:hypothetical protein CEXT_199101 [Caerostris extrusa]